MAATLRELVIIEDGLLVSMSGNTQFVTAFPFLRGLRINKKSGGCGCAKDKASLGNFSAAKQNIVGLSDDKKRELKTMLKAKRVRVQYVSGRKVQSVTF